MTNRGTHSLALALTALRLAACATPILQNHDGDSDGVNTEEEFKITMAVVIVIAVFGIGIAFFVGYYVGMTTTRKAPVQVRSTQHVTADTFVPAAPIVSLPAPAAAPVVHRTLATSGNTASEHADSALGVYMIKRGRQPV